jgi:hypothetical protein
MAYKTNYIQRMRTEGQFTGNFHTYNISNTLLTPAIHFPFIADTPVSIASSSSPSCTKGAVKNENAIPTLLAQSSLHQ